MVWQLFHRMTGAAHRRPHLVEEELRGAYAGPGAVEHGFRSPCATLARRARLKFRINNRSCLIDDCEEQSF